MTGDDLHSILSGDCLSEKSRDNARQRYQQRASDIPEIIRQQSCMDPIIHWHVQAYINGDICTLTEALCRMVLALSKARETQEKDWMTMLNATPPALVVSPPLNSTPPSAKLPG